MKHLRKTLTILACATASVCSAGPVPSVLVQFDTPIFTGSGSDNVYITFNRPDNSTVTEHVAAGRFKGSGSMVVGVPESIFVDGLNDLYMYCYDVYQDINHGSLVKYTINLEGELDRTRHFLGAVNAVLNDGKTEADPYAWLHPVTGFQGAAIQLGIWESKYDTSDSWSLTAGAFRAEALETATNEAWQSFVNAMGTSDPIDKPFIMVLESADKQDMITADPPPPNDVPEPGTLALLGAALAGLAWNQRRKSRAESKA